MHALTGTWNSTKTANRSFKIWPSGALEVHQDGRFVFETRISAGTTAAQVEALAEQEIPHPKKIKFESTTCRRCDGHGRNTAWGLDRNTCFDCGGTGSFLTEAGKEAQEVYISLLSTTFEHIEIGQPFRFKDTKKVWRKADEGSDDANAPVMKEDQESKRWAMRFVGTRYAGAKLTY